MKNIIKFFKTILNNRGEISNNVMTGLSVGVFAAVVGYSVYNAYNNSPAYNPANRAIYTGEGLNLGTDSFDGNRLDLQTPETLPGVVYNGSSQGGFNNTNTIKNDIAEEQANFDAARAYLDSQRSGANQADGAYGPRGETDAYSNGDVYNPFGTTYETGVSGLVEPGSRSGGSGYTEQQFQAAQQAAAAAASSAKGKGSKTGAPAVRQATQVGKLTASSGGSSFGNSAKGGSSLIGGNSGVSSGGVSNSGKDNNTRALPQAGAGQPVSTGAFKNGRSGGLGGFNVAAGKNGGTSAEQGGAKGGSRGGNAKAELNAAYNFSSKAVATLQSEGEKGFAKAAQEAANAFDGGAIDDGSGPSIDGKIPRNMKGNKLGGGLFGRGSLGLDTIQSDFEDHGTKKSRLLNCLKSHLTWALVATLIACIAIGFILQTKVWYTYLIAAVVAIAALYSIWLMDYDGDGMNIIQTISELAALRQEDGQSNPSWWAYGALGLMSGAVLTSFIWGPKVVSWFKSAVSDKVFAFVKKIFTSEATNQVKKAAGDAMEEGQK